LIAQRIYSYGSLMSPESPSYLERLHQAGISGLGFNLEAFDPRQLPVIAPGKAAFGRERIIESLRHAADVLGRGNSYTNLVYGVQSWRGVGAPLDFTEENARCLAATDELLAMGVVPLFTLYHYSGRNSIGPIDLDVDAVVDFHRAYARRLVDSGLIPPGRSGAVFSHETIANHLYNDAVVEARQAASGVSPTTGVPV
jgi:hypothetical protein